MVEAEPGLTFIGFMCLTTCGHGGGSVEARADGLAQAKPVPGPSWVSVSLQAAGDGIGT